jgi:hypothetical protein
MFYLSSLRLAFIRKSWGDGKMSELKELLADYTEGVYHHNVGRQLGKGALCG